MSWDPLNLKITGFTLSYPNNVTIFVKCMDINGISTNTTFTVMTKLQIYSPN